MSWTDHDLPSELRDAIAAAEAKGCPIDEVDQMGQTCLVVRYPRTDGRHTVVGITAANVGSPARHARLIHEYLRMMDTPSPASTNGGEPDGTVGDRV